MKKISHGKITYRIKNFVENIPVSNFMLSVCHCLSPFMGRLLRYKYIYNYEYLRILDFYKINLIHNSKVEDLLDLSYLQSLLDQLITYQFNVTEPYKNYKGFMVQYPLEFAQYLLTISKFNIQRYLEIGTFWGGSFITTFEYLTKTNPCSRYAFAIDRSYYLSMQLYSKIRKNVYYMIMDSKSPQFQSFIENMPPFDLVFIDGDHSYSGCKNDFDSVKDHAKLIAFHDILAVKDIKRLWDEIKHDYKYYEFIDNNRKRKYGIGLLEKI